MDGRVVVATVSAPVHRSVRCLSVGVSYGGSCVLLSALVQPDAVGVAVTVAACCGVSWLCFGWANVRSIVWGILF